MMNESEVQQPRIVVIGGGSGSFTLLKSLKNHTNNVTALVNMADDGGSTGVLRDELGVLPPGDVRQCLVALSQSSESLRELFNFRFPKGGTFEGHSFGNLFLSAVEMQSRNFGDAVDLASEVLNITGQVLPITLKDCRLVLRIGDQLVKGQHAIDMAKFSGKDSQPELWLEPHVDVNPAALEALEGADLVVIAPGNLYASLLPTLLVRGVKEALAKAQAPLVYVCNLVNKPTQTKDFAVHDYVDELERFIGKGSIDMVLYNIDRPSQLVLKKYAMEGEYPVKIDDGALIRASYRSIGGNFLSGQHSKRNAHDTLLRRSLIRHDGEAMARVLVEL